MANLQVMELVKFDDMRKLEKAIKNLDASGITDFYRNVINKMKSEGEKYGDQSLRVLSWILYAARPLKVEELVEALAVGENDKELRKRYMTRPERIVEMCDPLVDYDMHTRVIKFTHETVREFLDQQCKDDLYPPQELAKTCLHYLGLIDFDEPAPNEKALEIRLRTRCFTKYACEFWGYHARGAPKDETDIEEITIRVLETANRMQAVAQINRYASLAQFDIPQNTTLFHNLALNGLTTLCRRLLDKTMQTGGR